MNVASKELCQELYAVSKWGRMDNSTSTDHYYVARWVTVRSGQPDVMQDWEVEPWESFNEVSRLHISLDRGKAVPAYDLGYLLRKLPDIWVSIRKDSASHMRTKERHTSYTARYEHYALSNDFKGQIFAEVADTPEDAAAKLCIELIKQNIITPNQRERE